ncbi:MAG: PIN domain nuclease [Actinomycetota bacterium]|nr:PIN domain nuclease [Actinomycetota bacterium]
MILADTSAWIEYLNATGSPQSLRLRRAIADREVVMIDPILLEVLAGARRGVVDSTQRLLQAQPRESVLSTVDWLDAARICRELRWRGVTLRSQVDALIGAVALRLDLPVLHRDRDYDRIAEHTPLRVLRP